MISLPRDDLKKQEILQKIAKKFEKEKEECCCYDKDNIGYRIEREKNNLL